jgi:hypothetical protein
MLQTEPRQLPQRPASDRLPREEHCRVRQPVDFWNGRCAEDQRVAAQQPERGQEIERARVMVEDAGAEHDVGGADRLDRA